MTEISCFEAQASWYAVHAKRSQEHNVARSLTARGVRTFLPQIEVVRQYRERRRSSLEPLFPGYLFVHVAPPQHDPVSWNAVRWSPGVRRVVGVDGVPVPVPSSAIEAIRQKVAGLGFVRPSLRFAAGSRVRIRRGPLEGLEAIFDRPVSRAGRVRVLLHLLGHPRCVEVDALDLEPA